MLPRQFLEKFNERARAVLIHLSQTKTAPPQALDLLESILQHRGSLGANILNAHQINLEMIKKINKSRWPKKEIIKPAPSWPGECLKIILKKAAWLASSHYSRFIGTEHLLSAVLKQAEVKKDLQSLVNKEVVSHLEDQLKIILENSAKFPEISPHLEEEIERVLGESQTANTPTKPLKNPALKGPVKKEARRKNPPRAVDYFATELLTQAQLGQMDPLIGRKNELERLIKILSRRTKNNPMLVGEPGVGKTAIVLGLAQKMVAGDIPENLVNRKIFSVDMGLLIAGTIFRGEFEARLKDILQEAEEENALLFIDEIHTIIGAGSGGGGSLDAANILKPVIASGRVQIIGATTLEEYRKHIERDHAFERRFQTITVAEPSEQETIEILKGLKKHFESYHALAIDDRALEKAVWYAHRFIPDRHLPDKALDVLDEAAVEVKLASRRPMPRNLLKEKEIELLVVKNKKRQAILNENYEAALQWKTAEGQIEKEITALKTNAIPNNLLGAPAYELTLNEDAIRRAVSQISGIPLEQISAGEKNKLENLEPLLKSKIIGQDKAVEKLVAALKRSRAGLKEETRPLGSFMFLGPSGVGKTELAKILAQTYFENPKALIKLDMSEFSESHTVSKLIGAPAGYVGYEDSGRFIESVRRQPHSLVLFDEIEKAHPQIHNLLLQILEDGELTNAKGVKVSFKNSLIVFTSNIGNHHFWKNNRLGFGVDEYSTNLKENKKSVVKDLGLLMRPEFVSRLDEVVVFRPLKKEELKQITGLELDKLNERLAGNNLPRVAYPDKVTLWLAEKSFSARHGARKVRRNIRRFVENPLANLVVSGATDNCQKISADIIKNQLVWKFQKK